MSVERQVVAPVDNTDQARHSSRTAQVLALSLGGALCSGVGLLTAMVLSRVLTKGDYATYRQTFLTYSFAAPFLGLGIAQGIYYFLPASGARFRAYMSSAAAVLGLVGVFFGLFLALGGNQLLAARFSNDALGETLYYLLPFAPFYLLLSLLSPALVSLNRAAQLATFNVISRLCIATVIIGACLFYRNPEGPIIGNVAVTCLMSLAAVWLMVRNAPAGSWLPQIKMVRELIVFSIPLGLASMAGTTTIELGKVIVSALTTKEEFAVYVNGASEVPLIGIVTGSISSVLLVEIRRAIVQGQRDDAIRLFRKIASKTALVIFPAMFFLLLAADWFMQTLFSAGYAESARPFRIYLLLLPVRICFYGPLLVAAGKPNVVLFRSLVGMALTALLTVLLVKRMGYIGAATAAVIVTYAWNMSYNLWYIAKEFKIRVGSVLPFGDLGRIAAITGIPAVALWGVSRVWTSDSALTNLLVYGLVYWIVMAVWWNKKLYDVDAMMRKLQARFGSR